MKTSRGLSVTLIGPDIDHRKSLEAMLTGRVTELTWLPDSLSLRRGQPLTVWQRIRRALDQLSWTQDRSYLNETCRHLREYSTDVIVAYWGTIPLADISAIKRAMPHIKTVLVLLCFPLALDSMGLKRQYWMMRHAAKYIDAIIYSNQLMQEFVCGKVLGSRSKGMKGLILKPCWPRSYQSVATENGTCLDRPNLIFAGRTDLSSHTIHAADDMKVMMAEILGNEIELHHVRSAETTDGHPYRRTFEPLDQRGLIAKMATHDASLIAYNADACQRPERIELTVPDRLLSSVAAGVPIAIPSKGYTGPKQYLENYPAVFEFDSVPDLKLQLADRERVRAMHQAAWHARKLYTAEAQGSEFFEFLASLVGKCN
jgi:hypothetical protein